MRQIFQNRCRNFPENGKMRGPELCLNWSCGSIVQQNVLIAQFIYLITVNSHGKPPRLSEISEKKLEHIGKVIFDIPFMIESHAESMKKSWELFRIYTSYEISQSSPISQIMGWLAVQVKNTKKKKKKSILVHHTFESRLSIKNFDFANEFNRFKGPIFYLVFFVLWDAS